jgi:hypothetical protein
MEDYNVKRERREREVKEKRRGEKREVKTIKELTEAKEVTKEERLMEAARRALQNRRWDEYYHIRLKLPVRLRFQC